MTVSVRPRTKLLAALLAAGVVAATPAVTVSAPDVLPKLSTAAVQPASFVTDALYALGDAVGAGADAVSIAADAAIGVNYYYDNADFGFGVPFNPLFAAAIALGDPSQIGSLLSYAAQLYANPSDSYPYYTYPWYFKSNVLETLANILPSPLNAAVVNTLNSVADAINNAFSALPDPTAAVDAMANLYNTDIGNAIYGAQLALAAPVNVAVDVAYYVGYLPGDVEASVESAIQNPAEIPGLISYLAHSALNPHLYDGLLGNVAYNLANPLFYLPAPIGGTGGVVDNLYTNFVDGVDGLLSLLPSPVTPTPFPAAQAAAAAPERSSLAVDSERPTKKAPGESTGKQRLSGAQLGAAATTDKAAPAAGKAASKPKAGNDGASGAAAGHGHAKPSGGSGKSHGGAAA